MYWGDRTFEKHFWSWCFWLQYCSSACLLHGLPSNRSNHYGVLVELVKMTDGVHKVRNKAEEKSLYVQSPQDFSKPLLKTNLLPALLGKRRCLMPPWPIFSLVSLGRHGPASGQKHSYPWRLAPSWSGLYLAATWSMAKSNKTGISFGQLIVILWFITINSTYIHQYDTL